MRGRLFWKLLGINLLVVALAVAVSAVLVARLAEEIFANLMHDFNIKVDLLHGRFVGELARSLLLASIIAVTAGTILSIVLTRRVTSPVQRMMRMAEQIARGNYAARVDPVGGDELVSLGQTLNQMAGSLATLERLRKDLVANVAHELRTPLSNLRGYLEALRDGVAPATGETIGMLHGEVMRLVRLVEGLHELSHFDARLPALHREPVNLRELVEPLLALRSGEFATKKIALASHIAAGLIVEADPDLLSQAASNLVDNALKYTPSEGQVSVDASLDNGIVRLAVTNSGEGISPEDLPFIFERFYRGEKSRSRSSGGAGIGLAIVSEVARAHGGRAGAASGDGRTTVWIALPPS
ncbi:MAG: sensor histidine kinase [bacterium]